MEIVIRAAVMFVLVWVLLRGMGERELSEMTTFELIVLVVLGDIIQQGVTQEDMSFTGSLLAISTMALLAVALSVSGNRFRRLRPILEGRPSVVVRDGTMVLPTIKSLRMHPDEVLEAARKHGATDLTRFQWVIVEDDGGFSFIEYPPEDTDSNPDDPSTGADET